MPDADEIFKMLSIAEKSNPREWPKLQPIHEMAMKWLEDHAAELKKKAEELKKQKEKEEAEKAAQKAKEDAAKAKEEEEPAGGSKPKPSGSPVESHPTFVKPITENRHGSTDTL